MVRPPLRCDLAPAQVFVLGRVRGRGGRGWGTRAEIEAAYLAWTELRTCPDLERRAKAWGRRLLAALWRRGEIEQAGNVWRYLRRSR